MKKIAVGFMVAVVIVLAVLAQSAPAYAGQKHQHLAGVLFQDGQREAQVMLSVVDLGPMKRISPKAFKKGLIIRDEAGRQIVISGDAVIDRGRDTNQFQVFILSNVEIGPGSKVYNVTHLFVAHVSGDYDHPDFLCSSPQASIDRCVGFWLISLDGWDTGSE